MSVGLKLREPSPIACAAAWSDEMASEPEISKVFDLSWKVLTKELVNDDLIASTRRVTLAQALTGQRRLCDEECMVMVSNFLSFF